ncbi:MBL fold metallo-hydrolase [Fredinandcohnia aciditolerans]|uniref:MBL fold metallo-hydrolase n=1 Tax=Ferdinandcohnia sp. SAFN-114 TaxID=3387275 RepID=UPI001FE8677F
MLFKKEDVEVFPISVPTSNELKSINFFLVKQGRALSLIDAGLNNEECWNSLQKTLKMHDYTLTDITEILLTHHHSDHIGLVNRILSTHSIPIYAHPDAILRLKRDGRYMNMRVDFFKKLYQEMGCGQVGEKQVIDINNPIILNDDNRIDCEIQEISSDHLLGFTILEIPGHAPDLIGFYNKQNKWLFAGDLLIENMSSNAFIEPDYNGNRIKSLLQLKHSLEKCLQLQVDFVFPGHGPIIRRPTDLINKRLKRIDDNANKYIHIIKSGITTVSEIAQFIYREKYEIKFFNIMSEVIGYLDYLEFHGKVNKTMEKRIWHYYC